MSGKRPDLSKRNRSNARHGMSASRTYNIWRLIKYRCESPASKDYVRYGGRGIKLCREWSEDFVNFLQDMGEAPVGMQIDRIDNDKGYQKDNCRWTTPVEQANNRRTCRPLTYKGETKPVKQWAKEFGIEWKTLAYRLRAGWPPEKALNTPSLIPRKKDAEK